MGSLGFFIDNRCWKLDCTGITARLMEQAPYQSRPEHPNGGCGRGVRSRCAATGVVNASVRDLVFLELVEQRPVADLEQSRSMRPVAARGAQRAADQLGLQHTARWLECERAFPARGPPAFPHGRG